MRSLNYWPTREIPGRKFSFTQIFPKSFLLLRLLFSLSDFSPYLYKNRQLLFTQSPLPVFVNEPTFSQEIKSCVSLIFFSYGLFIGLSLGRFWIHNMWYFCLLGFLSAPKSMCADNHKEICKSWGFPSLQTTVHHPYPVPHHDDGAEMWCCVFVVVSTWLLRDFSSQTTLKFSTDHGVSWLLLLFCNTAFRPKWQGHLCIFCFFLLLFPEG